MRLQGSPCVLRGFFKKVRLPVVGGFYTRAGRRRHAKAGKVAVAILLQLSDDSNKRGFAHESGRCFLGEDGFSLVFACLFGLPPFSFKSLLCEYKATPRLAVDCQRSTIKPADKTDDFKLDGDAPPLFSRFFRQVSRNIRDNNFGLDAVRKINRSSPRVSA